MKSSKQIVVGNLLLCTAIWISACSNNSAQSSGIDIMGGTVTPTAEINITLGQTPDTPTVSTLTPTITPLPATPTASNLVARVNGQEITKDQFGNEMLRYIAADPSSPDPDSPEGQQLAVQLKDTVLEAMIEQVLIEQEATRNKVTVSDKQVDEEITNLIQIRGGRDAFDAWLSANKQTEQGMRELIRRELIANLMRDKITELLPRTAEYVHAYHIVVATETEAQSVLTKLRNGAKFTTLAQSLSIDESTRPDGGDLGWFTRGTGSVLWNEVEDAAFALQKGQISPIVKSPIGYHIIKVVDRQTRALTAEDTAFVQQAALAQWIARLVANAKIEKFI